MTAFSLLIASTQVPADTVVSVAARDGYDVMIAVAAGLIAATFLAVLLGLLFLFYQARLAIRTVETLRRNFVEDPAIQSLRTTTAHVEGIARVVRSEVTELTESLGTVSERIRQASDRMEERIEEFNALMEVVQEEAEGVFVDTAASARGVRRGVSHLGDASVPAGRERDGRGPDGRTPSTAPHPDPESPARPSPPGSGTVADVHDPLDGAQAP